MLMDLLTILAILIAASAPLPGTVVFFAAWAALVVVMLAFAALVIGLLPSEGG